MTPQDFHKRRDAAKALRETAKAQSELEPFQAYNTGGLTTPLGLARQDEPQDELEPFERSIIDRLTAPRPRPVSGLDVLDQRKVWCSTNADTHNSNCWARGMFRSGGGMYEHYSDMYEDLKKQAAFYSQAFNQPFDTCDIMSVDVMQSSRHGKTREKQITYDPSKWTGRKA